MSSRRRFLGALGAAASAPLLGGLLSRIAGAAEGEAPLRFVLLFTGNGHLPEHWLPTGGGASFGLTPMLSPLAPLRDKLLLINGFSGWSGHGGGMSDTTTGRASDTGIPTGGPSLDQLLADAWRGRTPLPSLELGVLPANDPYDHIVYSAAGLPVPPIGSALGAFDRVFGVTNLDPAVAEARRAHQRSVLDAIGSDLASVQARIGPSARRLLDEHLTLVRQRELELEQPFRPTTCELHEPPSGSGLVDTWRAHDDTIVAALRCDVTRVVTLRVGGWGGIESGGYDEIGLSAGHHDASHGGGADPEGALLAIGTFHAERFAALAQALDAVPEGDGTLLDATVLVWVNELGLAPLNDHGRDDLPVVLVGGGRAGLANGVYRTVPGTEWAHALFTLAHALGETGLTSFGDAGNRIVDELLA